MSTSVETQKLWEVREPPPSKPLDETVWRAWLKKGHARDQRRAATRILAVESICLAGLIVIAGAWSHLESYSVIARFFVAAGSVVLMFHSMGARRYAWAGVFAVVALLFNPLVPMFSFSGDWSRALVLASAVPFVASIAAPLVRKVPNA